MPGTCAEKNKSMPNQFVRKNKSIKDLKIENKKRHLKSNDKLKCMNFFCHEQWIPENNAVFKTTEAIVLHQKV